MFYCSFDVQAGSIYLRFCKPKPLEPASQRPSYSMNPRKTTQNLDFLITGRPNPADSAQTRPLNVQDGMKKAAGPLGSPTAMHNSMNPRAYASATGWARTVPSGNARRNRKRAMGPATSRFHGRAMMKFQGMLVSQAIGTMARVPACSAPSKAP